MVEDLKTTMYKRLVKFLNFCLSFYPNFAQISSKRFTSTYYNCMYLLVLGYYYIYMDAFEIVSIIADRYFISTRNYIKSPGFLFEGVAASEK